MSNWNDIPRPTADANAAESQLMASSNAGRRVNRNAITAGTTRKVNTRSTPATGTASVMASPKDA